MYNNYYCGVRMKKRLFIIACIILSFQLVLMTGCEKKIRDPNSATNYLKDLLSYSCNAEIKVKNDLNTYTYSTNQTYSRENGCRIELGKDRVYLYKDNKIYVTDIINNLKYVMDKNVDGIFRLSMIEEYVDLLYTDENIKYKYKIIDGEEYQFIELIIPGNNRNMRKATLCVNSKTNIPHNIYIYDSNGKERVEVIYSNFQPNIEVNKALFDVK
jgi:outer membrane lipoprotein-sorting protein